jgi:pentatricopeptide repeat protein
MIWSFGQSGNIEESLRLFNEMKTKQIRPSIYIYRSLIASLKKMGKIELAMTFLEEMNASMSNLAGPKDFKRTHR